MYEFFGIIGKDDAIEGMDMGFDIREAVIR